MHANNVRRPTEANTNPITLDRSTSPPRFLYVVAAAGIAAWLVDLARDRNRVGRVARVASPHAALPHVALPGLALPGAGLSRASLPALPALQSAAARRQSRAAAAHQEDVFIAMIAHELRNPLAPLRNALELSQRVQGDPQALSLARRIMERQLEHLVHLVDDLVDVGRICSGQFPLRIERVELAAVLHPAIVATRKAFEATRQSLTVGLPAQAIPLRVDPARLTQVIGNLLEHAGRLTAVGGRVLLWARREGRAVSIAIRASDDAVSAGLPPPHPAGFTPPEPTLGRAPGGLAIGLVLAQRLVTMLGGTLTSRSAGAGHGSEFIVRLPIYA